MARAFAGAGHVVSIPFSDIGVPLTIAARYNQANASDGVGHAVAGLFRTSGGGNPQGHYLFVQASQHLRAFSTAVGSFPSSESNQVSSSDTWYSAVGVYAAADSRQAFLNAAAGAVETTSLSPSYDTLVIGAWSDADGNLSDSSGHRLAHVAVWNVALTQSDVDAWHAGADARAIRPASLREYCLVEGGMTPRGLVSGQVATLSGATSYDDPVIVLPYRSRAAKFASAPGGSRPVGFLAAQPRHVRRVA